VTGDAFGKLSILSLVQQVSMILSIDSLFKAKAQHVTFVLQKNYFVISLFYYFIILKHYFVIFVIF